MRFLRPSTRAIVGFLFAPLLAAVVCAVASPLAGGSLFSSIGLVPVVYLFAFVASGFLGLPIFLVLHRLGLVRWWSASLAGAVVGAAVAIALVLPNPPKPMNLAFLVGVGIGSALSFWAIWRLGAPRPNPSIERTSPGEPGAASHVKR
jgi:hypothetical protein